MRGRCVFDEGSSTLRKPELQVRVCEKPRKCQALSPGKVGRRQASRNRTGANYAGCRHWYHSPVVCHGFGFAAMSTVSRRELWASPLCTLIGGIARRTLRSSPTGHGGVKFRRPPPDERRPCPAVMTPPPGFRTSCPICSRRAWRWWLCRCPTCSSTKHTRPVEPTATPARGEAAAAGRDFSLRGKRPGRWGSRR